MLSCEKYKHRFQLMNSFIAKCEDDCLKNPLCGLDAKKKGRVTLAAVHVSRNNKKVSNTTILTSGRQMQICQNAHTHHICYSRHRFTPLHCDTHKPFWITQQNLKSLAGIAPVQIRGERV